MTFSTNDQLHQLAQMFSYPVIFLANKLSSIFNSADEEKYDNITELINFEQGTTYHTITIRGLIQTLEQYITNKIPLNFDVHTLINNFSRVSLNHHFVNYIQLITQIEFCPICQQKFKFEKHNIVAHDIDNSYSATLFIAKCTHPYSKSMTKHSPFIAYPNFVLKGRTKEFTTQSMDNGNYIFINGHYAYSRDLFLLFESSVIELRASFMGFTDTLNSFASRRSTPRVQIDRRRLEESFLVYQLVQFDFFMGKQSVSIPHYFVHLDNYIFDQFPLRYIAFVYFWSNHKQFIGPCSQQCSKAAVMDGHTKSRRRICNYKDVTVSTSEYDKIVKGCHVTPSHGKKYCTDHAFAETELLPEVPCQSSTKETTVTTRQRTRPPKEYQQATSCKTLKRKPDAYVRKCARSFGLIAQVFNCRVITAFSEIYRSETIKQILDMIFTAIRISDVCLSQYVYDDGCHCIEHFQKRRNDGTIKSTPAALRMDNVQWSIDRMHVKNHTRQYCKTVLNPDFNPALQNINTECAEETFSHLKGYCHILSSMAHYRASTYLLLLFHLYNARSCNILPSSRRSLSQLPTVDGVSLAHVEEVTSEVDLTDDEFDNDTQPMDY